VSGLEAWNALSSTWAEAIWRSCWQGAVGIAGIGLVCAVFRRLPISARYLLWWLVCLKMLLALAPISIPIPILQAPRPTPYVVSVAAPSVAAYVSAAPEPARPDQSLYLLALWTVGVCATTVIVAGPLLRTLKASRQAEAAREPWLLAEAAEVAARLGMRSVPRILISDEFDDILTFGLFRPLVLISRKSFAACSDEERRMVLAHEFAHVRRRDAFWALVPQVAQIVFFFHPLVWLASREFHFAREAECDRAALESIPAGADRYGRLLIRLGSDREDGPALCLPGMSSQFRVLRRRISMLQHPSTRTSLRTRRGLAATLGATALLGLAPFSLVQGQTSSNIHPAVLKKPVATIVKNKAAHKAKKVAVVAKAKPAIVQSRSASPVTPSTVAATTFPLQYAKASETSTLLNQLFKGAGVQIIADSRTNMVLVRGPVDRVAEIQKVIGNLDTPSPAEEKTQAKLLMRIYPLKYAMAPDALKVLMGALPSRRGSAIVMDERTNSIIATGDEDRHQAILNLLSNVDRPVQEDLQVNATQTYVFPLQHADAAAIAQILSGLKKDKAVTYVAPDRNTNSIILTVSTRTWTDVRDIIRQLDVPAKPKG
jgi:beta-lactamase regulating signal transducer with metallopeptidase domain